MARKRMIDPSIWTDEGMADLTPRQQLLYIGMFSNADDDGRLKGSPAAISLMLPTLYSGVAKDDVEDDIAQVCAAMRKLSRYSVDGRDYLAFENFRTWQRVDKPTPSILPAPPEASPQNDESSTPNTAESATPRGAFDDDSPKTLRALPPNRREEKGREQKETLFGAQAAPDGGSTDEPEAPKGPRPVLSAVQQERFDRWYAAYPKKRARPEAEKAWAKIRPAPDDAMTDAMIQIVRLWSGSPEWTKDGGAYIPHPATWLNKGRYTDEPPGAIRPAKDPNVLERGLARAG